MATRPSVLFLIRDKLGDSLIAANVALHFARLHPEWAVSIMLRGAYALPLADETTLRVIPYRTGAYAQLLGWWWRLTGQRFDVLGVMRGVGSRTRRLVRSVPARRVIVGDDSLASVATEVVSAGPGARIGEPHHVPAWRVARALDAGLAEPHELCFPGLRQRWIATAKQYVVLCPVSDERRRNIPVEAIEALYATLRHRHPDREVLVLVRGEFDLKGLARVPGVPIKGFCDLQNLIGIFLQASHYYGTDTGLLHLAAAMGMPCTIFFGPTQAHRVLPLAQPDINVWRAPVLGERHCYVKDCSNAICISRAVSMFVGGEDTASEPTRSDCPLG